MCWMLIRQKTSKWRGVELLSQAFNLHSVYEIFDRFLWNFIRYETDFTIQCDVYDKKSVTAKNFK